MFIVLICCSVVLSSHKPTTVSSIVGRVWIRGFCLYPRLRLTLRCCCIYVTDVLWFTQRSENDTNATGNSLSPPLATHITHPLTLREFRSMRRRFYETYIVNSSILAVLVWLSDVNSILIWTLSSFFDAYPTRNWKWVVFHGRATPPTLRTTSEIYSDRPQLFR